MGGSELRLLYLQGQDTNSTAGLSQSMLQIACSMTLIGLMHKTALPLRKIYSGCLFVGAAALTSAKFCVGNSVGLAVMVVTVMAIPFAAISAFPYALVGALNKRAQEEGQVHDMGVQMGLLNIFIVVPQLIATVVVGSMQHSLGVSALPWAFFIAGVSFAIGGCGALALNDRHVAHPDGMSTAEMIPNGPTR